VSKFTPLTDELHDYLVAHGAREDELLRRLREETEEVAGDLAVMQIAPDQGALMGLLARALGARRALELGTFTGYSAICIARALPPDGTLVACDVSEEWTAIARRYFERAGVAERIDLRLAPAIETLRTLPDDEPFDLAFIDADKEGYPDYWEECVRLVRPGGLILIDNVLAAGRVLAPPGEREPQVEAIMRTNELVAADERVELAMTPVADGLTFALRR
jgi:caffeoyl-CoA O-methyltransferase